MIKKLDTKVTDKMEGESWENKLRDFEYTNHNGQNLYDFISKELQSCKEQTKKEIVEKIKNSRTIEEEKFGIGLREETARSQVLADILILLK